MTFRPTGTAALLSAGLALAVGIRARAAYGQPRPTDIPEYAPEERTPEALEGITVDDKRGAQIDLGLRFKDHEGRDVTLKDYFGDGKPVLLTLNYYKCRMLCSLELNGVADALRELEWSPGEQFRVLTVSIDPREGPALAQAKRQSYLGSLDRGDVDWAFLTGAEDQSKALAEAVGFHYRFVPEEDQYAHSAAIFFLSGQGVLTKALFGVKYLTRDVKFALMEASEGKIGSTFDRILLSCYHYDDLTGAYSPFAFGIMRLGGALVALLLGVFLIVMWRRERVRRRTELVI